jgi:polysaccharide pyruvyl transferase WcaK-like protein
MRLVHIGAHESKNAGDIVLLQAVRDLFDKYEEIKWAKCSLWGTYNDDIISQLNEFDGIVIGGGGVLLRDTNENNKSGWQLACTIERLKKINKPIYVFAIGYNKFRGQKDFAPIFKEHLGTLIEQSKFFGVRNRGSQRAIGDLIPQEKVVYQPCPTTVLNRLHYYPPVKKIDKIAVNLAGDRATWRYGGKEDWVVSSICSAADRAGVELITVKHLSNDLIIPHTKVVSFSNYDEVIDFYRKVPMTIGTRGHSQMIPFGLGNSITSLITHDKLSWFLEDIGHPEWGIDINEPIEEKILERINSYKDDKIENEELWDITLKNMERIFDA